MLLPCSRLRYVLHSYLSLSIICHPIHRNKLLAISLREPPLLPSREELPVVNALNTLFSALGQELGGEDPLDDDEDERVMVFFDEVVSTSIEIMYVVCLHNSF